MADSVNVFTFLVSGAELKKAFPESDLSHALIKVNLEPKEIGGKKHGTITLSIEAHHKSDSRSPKTHPIIMDGCPVPPCTPPH